MREYELTYLVSDDVLEADLKKITDKVAGFITSGDGKITKEESWGRRKLAYPIEKQNFATYITVWFEIEVSKLTELDHELRVLPQVIRHLTTLKVEWAKVLNVTKEDIVDAQDVGDVIGERSFELIEGETEGSKDLMAVREGAKNDEVGSVEHGEEKVVEEKPAQKVEKKIIKPKKVEKLSKEDEADRMKKLDEKLDQLLSDDL